MEIVSAVHRALAGKVGQDRYLVWFGRGVRMEPCGTTLRIAAADTFRLDYLRRAFHADLAEAARIAGNLLNLEFIVDPAAGATETLTSPVPAAPQKPAAPQAAAEHARPVASGARANGKHAEEEPKHKQLRRQFASLADFLASEPNRVALSAAQTAATRPGTYSPLTLVGPPGCGKTHLLEGIWRHVRHTQNLSSVIYLSAEQFTNQFIDAIRNTGAPNFRRKIRDVEMLLIDDVQFFGGKQSTLVEVVHTIDTLLRRGKQLVFAADRPLAELRGLGPEIVTRLAGGLVCTLEPADFATRLGILKQISLRMALTVPDEVLTWLAGQIEGDARHLAGALNRLRAASEAHQEPIGLEFAQGALGDLIHASRRPIRLPDIVEAVCDVTGISAEELQSTSKLASVTFPRMLVMFLARKWTRAGLSEISRTLGRKSHSTVVSAQHKVNEWLADGKTMSLGHAQCRVEDTIKRIESQLRLA